jgi:hypothetical protein
VHQSSEDALVAGLVFSSILERLVLLGTSIQVPFTRLFFAGNFTSTGIAHACLSHTQKGPFKALLASLGVVLKML